MTSLDFLKIVETVDFRKTVENLAVSYPGTSTFFFLTGAYVLGSFSLKVVRLALQLTIQRGTNLKKYGAGNGAWAVVTGASGGIGREFALQLAKKGFNVALLGRSTSKLETVSKELAALPGVKASVTQYAIDLASANDEEWAALDKALSALNIGVLVNNAGINRVAPYVADDGKVQAEIVNVNVTAVLRLTSIVLPGMVARNRGLVVSTGSLNGGAAPMPLTTVYSGSKAFLVTWTQALGIELAKMKSAVDVAVINAGYVAGGMAVGAKPSFVTPDGERFVRAVLRRVGLPVGAIGRRFVWTPYWSHALLEFFVRSLGLETLAANATYDSLIKLVDEQDKAK